MGMGLALLQRFVLLSVMAWLVGLREPLFTCWGKILPCADIILVAGGVFLLFKGSQELHEKLEENGGNRTENAEGGAGFWTVVVQIVALDAFFSFDSVLTAVGMASDVTMMMAAVAVAMADYVARRCIFICLCGALPFHYRHVSGLHDDGRGEASFWTGWGFPYRGAICMPPYCFRCLWKASGNSWFAADVRRACEKVRVEPWWKQYLDC